MNSETKSSCNCAAKAAWALAVIGALVIVIFIDSQLKKYTAPPPVDAGRAEERAKALAEIRNAESEALSKTDWLDQGKGIVRLRIDDAMKLMEEKWKDPAAGRADLLSRVEKANPPPPAPAPAKPSAFE